MRNVIRQETEKEKCKKDKVVKYVTKGQAENMTKGRVQDRAKDKRITPKKGGRGINRSNRYTSENSGKPIEAKPIGKRRVQQGNAEENKKHDKNVTWPVE